MNKEQKLIVNELEKGTEKYITALSNVVDVCKGERAKRPNYEEIHKRRLLQELEQEKEKRNMIKILKQGTIKKEHITYKVTCDNCGCEFECGIEDLTIEKRLNGKRTIKCPHCGKELEVGAKHERK